jgi:hypothetical protein
MAGEKVIVAEIDDDAGKAPTVGTDQISAAEGDRMRIGKSIDFSVQRDAVHDGWIVLAAQPPFDKIAQQVADERVGGALGQTEMSQVVHDLGLWPVIRLEHRGGNSIVSIESRYDGL